VGWLDFDCVRRTVGSGFLLPSHHLLKAAFGKLIEWDAEVLDQVFRAVVYEIRRLFGEMFGAIGHEVAQALQPFVAHLVGTANSSCQHLRSSVVCRRRQQRR